MKRIAFCDFDGTLSKGYISMGFLDHLYNQGIYPKNSYDKHIKIYNDTKAGIVTYESFCEMWGFEWALGLKGLKSELIQQEAKRFFKEFKKNIHPSSYPLVSLLKDSGYYVPAISVGAYEVISLAAKEVGMDRCYATQLEVKEGIYTGYIETRLHIPSGKSELLRDLAEKRRISLKDCLALGDSVGDIGMFEMVGNPIALNPSEALLKVAKERGWHSFRHDNVVEEIKKIL